MANPNIVNVASIYANTKGMTVTSSVQDLIAATETSTGKVVKLNSIIISNVDGSNNDSITVNWYDASAVVTYPIVKEVVVVAKSTLVVLGKDAPIYLNEGDKITVQGVAASGDLVAIASYETLSE